jgi:hypothetical protein
MQIIKEKQNDLKQISEILEYSFQFFVNNHYLSVENVGKFMRGYAELMRTKYEILQGNKNDEDALE